MNLCDTSWLYFRQYQLIVCILISSNTFVYLQHIDHNVNNSCPSLFSTLNDCDCVHVHTIDCSYSTSLTHLPRSWRSTVHHNLTLFTQSIQRVNILHATLLTQLKTDEFYVGTRLDQSSYCRSLFILGSRTSSLSIDCAHWSCDDSAACIPTFVTSQRTSYRI
jgi:hypothetical protein